jgi:ABC-type lipoprotein export system ATPase subunit
MEQERDEQNRVEHAGDATQLDAPILRVENLTKTFRIPDGKLQVLRDIYLYVQRGEFIAITGPSGSGKTTLLSLLGALDSPDGGEIWLEERAVHRLRGTAAADFRRNQVGFVFQLFYLLPNLTALENVMAPLLPYRRKMSFDLKKRAQELLERVGLADRQGYPPARLSGGEQQRVAIARALVNPATGEEVLEALRELQRDGNQTLIMVTHDPHLAALADRRIQLEQLRRTGERV